MMADTATVISNITEKFSEVADIGQIRVQKLLDSPDKHCTDLGNARRLVNRYGDRIRYCSEMGSWFIWDNNRYAKDTTQRIRTLAFETAKGIYMEAAHAISDGDRKELADWAIQSENLNRNSAMISMAQPLVPVAVSEMDSNPYLFNVQNGTIDLRTGKLLPHSPKRIITKVAPVEYQEDAGCPTFLTFLYQIMDGNENLMEFLQRAVGYSMLGAVFEEVLIFLYGTGANGKSVFLNTLLSVFGDYGQPTDPELLIAKRGEVHPAGVADLLGARLAVTNELEDGKRLAENLVKQLTGGDKLKARFMRQNFFEFTPTHTLWMAGNHKPVVRGQDEGIWRRIRLVPFSVTIPPEKRDPHLKEKLQAEASGILRWAIEGCLKWQQDGLTYPEEVRVAVDNYRAESDSLGDFLEEVCVIDPNAQVASKVFYKEYLEWCDDNGQRPYSQKRLATLIEQKHPNVKRTRTNSSRIWTGIGLKEVTHVTHRDAFLERTPYTRKEAVYTKNESLSVTCHGQWEEGDI